MNVNHLKVTWVRVETLQPANRNARTHSRDQVRQIARSVERFGFTNPILVDDDGFVIAGHGRLEAAKLLGMKEVPVIRLSHLSADERRAYALADNKLAENAGWDREVLAIELEALAELDFDLELTGFCVAEIDIVLDDYAAARSSTEADDIDIVPPTRNEVVSKAGDLWLLGRHKLLCGDALCSESLDRLMGSEVADLLFTDPPYNVKISGNVCGLGSVKHREFAMASGEMSEEGFTTFLSTALGHAADRLRDGAIAYVCMDWRHIRELLVAGERAFSEFKNLCVWNKTNAGMGTFYRSKHELVFVFKKGEGSHINNFGLGENGRYRTNVWDYPGMSSIGPGRSEELAMHPTVKPVAMIADAIRDCSNRGGIILDPFGGSGSTLIAAEKTGRSARLIEIDPAYCDTIIRRFMAFTSQRAVNAATGEAFAAPVNKSFDRDDL